MVKIVGVIGLAVAAFVGTVIATAAATGKLNKESLDYLMGRGEEVEEASAPEDPIGPIASKMKEDRRLLDERTEEMDEREARLELREQDFLQTVAAMEELQVQLDTALEELDAERATRIKETAEAISAMKADGAAASLASQPPEDAAEILRLIEPRKQGKILDAMDDRIRNILISIMIERKY